MKNRYQVQIIWETIIPGSCFPTIKEAIESIRRSWHECCDDETIIWDREKERVVRRCYWGDFYKGGKYFKPPTCPKCKSKNTIEIQYGYPTQKSLDRAERGEIFLGGCEVSSENPDYHCKDCGKDFLSVQENKNRL